MTVSQFSIGQSGQHNGLVVSTVNTDASQQEVPDSIPR